MWRSFRLFWTGAAAFAVAAMGFATCVILAWQNNGASTNVDASSPSVPSAITHGFVVDKIYFFVK
jgi:hypothetical protein